MKKTHFLAIYYKTNNTFHTIFFRISDFQAMGINFRFNCFELHTDEFQICCASFVSRKQLKFGHALMQTNFVYKLTPELSIFHLVI